jgi:hypothetical protein
MAQPARLRPRWPCGRGRKREEFDLGRTHP